MQVLQTAPSDPMPSAAEGMIVLSHPVRFDNRHEAAIKDLASEFELLFYHVVYAACAGLLDDGPHFGSEYSPGIGLDQQRAKIRHGFHQLDAVVLDGQHPRAPPA
jgi:hypothetical protein